MARSVAVVSSVYGGFDVPHAPPEQDIPCEWVMVTDTTGWPSPWREVVEPRPQMCPRLAAKVAKCWLERYSDADVLIWIDGNVQIHDAGFASWCLSCLGGAPLAQFDSSPVRTGIREEAAVAAGMAKYAGQPVWQQAEAYIADGHPDNWGNWWSGLIVRRRDCPDFGTGWLAEMTRWGCECQISEPYVLRQTGLRPAGLPREDFGRHFSIRGHQAPG